VTAVSTRIKISEKYVQNDVVRNLRALGFFVSTFSQAQRAQMTAGIPDMFCAHGKYGIALWVEMKAPHRRSVRNGGLSEAQLLWQLLAREAGLAVITAYGWLDVANELRKRGVPIQGLGN
jgi:hypothetical protein